MALSIRIEQISCLMGLGWVRRNRDIKAEDSTTLKKSLFSSRQNCIYAKYGQGMQGSLHGFSQSSHVNSDPRVQLGWQCASTILRPPYTPSHNTDIEDEMINDREI